MGRNKSWIWAALVVAMLLLVVAEGKKEEKKEKICNKGWECKNSKFCCNETITDYFQVYQFENLFSKRNYPVAHAVGFWDYQAFIIAAAEYEPLGFGTTGGKNMGMKEVAAFLGHVGSKTSCKLPFTFLLCQFFSFLLFDFSLGVLTQIFKKVTRSNSLTCTILFEHVYRRIWCSYWWSFSMGSVLQP
jgi:Chitinase class I